MVLSIGIVACLCVCGCGDKQEKVPDVTAKQLEELKSLSEEAKTTRRSTAVTDRRPIVNCSIAIAYINSAKTRFGMKNDDFSRRTPLTTAQIAPFMTDGKDFASLECPKGGAYSINMLAREPSCSKCTQ
jgi:hypothetical protein